MLLNVLISSLLLVAEGICSCIGTTLEWARSSSATYYVGANVSSAPERAYTLEDTATADALESFCFTQ
jgi:hypothetical protein